MYHLTVANDHTYAVGDDQVVVHNTCGPRLPEQNPSKMGHIFRQDDGKVLLVN